MSTEIVRVKKGSGCGFFLNHIYHQRKRRKEKKSPVSILTLEPSGRAGNK